MPLDASVVHPKKGGLAALGSLNKRQCGAPSGQQRGSGGELDNTETRESRPAVW
jgi:hypothetical protein